MFVSKKDVLREARDTVATRLDDVMPLLSELCQASTGITVRGITVSPTRKGDGFLCVLRVTVDETEEGQELAGGVMAGNYVVFGHGDDVLTALGCIEATLATGQATLTPDRYHK